MDNQETNPTPEQWQQQQQNRNYQQPPYNQPFSMPEEYQQQPRGSKFGGGMGAIFIAVALSLVLCYAMISFLGITPSMKQYKADITRLEMDLVDIRTVNDGQATNIGNLAGAVATANSAATKATSALELGNTLQTQYSDLNTALTALQTRVTDLEGNTGDVYDDTVVKGLIDAVEDDIAEINTTIDALQYYDTERTITIKAKIAQLQEIIDGITDGADSSSLSTLQTKMDNIYSYITGDITDTNSLKYQLKQITNRISALESGSIYFTEFNSDFDYCTFKVTTNGRYIVIITLYGKNFTSTDPFKVTTESPAIILSSIIISDNMAVLALTQKDVSGYPTDWTANTIVSIGKNNSAVNIMYGTIQMGER